ncbi:E3 ubiquitin-protein ligase FANCL [Blattella germanica]|nr:E3 ubiquitin-protein ligase FANCL [Blattella germanica]
MADEEFHISLHVPHYPSLLNLSLKCSWELSVILQGHEQDLSEWTKNCSSLINYLECLLNLIVKCLTSANSKSLLHSGEHLSVESYKHIISELEVLDPKNIVHVSNMLNDIELQTLDNAGRQHFLTLHLGINYPSVPPVIQVSSISTIYKSFVQQVTLLQKFWQLLDEMDHKCWVIDPDNPTRKDSYRRIMIGNNVSIQITVDPLKPTERPDIKFLGSERAIVPFQEALAEKFEMWNNKDGIVENLLLVLNLPAFPSTPLDSSHSQDLVHPGDCSICFTARFNGELPSRACNNEKCGMIYHDVCLFEWLQTLPTSSKSFDYIHGECPNCGMVSSSQLISQ